MTSLQSEPVPRIAAPVDTGEASNDPHELARRVAFAVTLVPFSGAVVAGVQVLAREVSRFELTLLAVTYFLTLVGVEVGFHRMVAHGSFEAARATRLVLSVLGSMTAEGPLAWWVATHRRHHQVSDLPGDPHSPHVRGNTRTRGFDGFVHAHLTWMWSPVIDPDASKYLRDVLRDRTLLFVNRTYFVWVIVGLVAPALAGALWFGSIAGFARGLLWGGLVRMSLVHNAMWCVASVCHLTGSRDYRVHAADRSRNTWWLAIPTFGESWHNNHHAFPTSARHGLEWWQLDLNYFVIRCLAVFGLASSVKLPSSTARSAKLLRRRSRA